MAEQKKEWLDVMDEAKRQGVSQARVCRTVGLTVRRIERWRRWNQTGRGLTDGRPGPRQAPHRLLSEEKQSIVSYACREENVDLASRIVAYRGLDRGELAASPSSLYRTLVNFGLTSPRGKARRARSGGAAPVREELTGPNQRWCWDITYLRTPVKYSFLYLYLMLDEWSRKELAWLIATVESSELGKELLDRALEAEGLWLGEGPRPVVVNDRGPSMKAKTLQQFFADLGVHQVFARPRTPDDNPFIEAAFRTVKYHPDYPDFFTGEDHAQTYFHGFFPWYNHEHLHSAIGHVPPAVKHAGLDGEIQKHRRERLEEARSRRLEVNRRALKNRIVGTSLLQPICSLNPL